MNTRFVRNSVHVSTKKLSGHEAPTKSNDYQGAAASRLQCWLVAVSFSLAVPSTNHRVKHSGMQSRVLTAE